MIKRNLIWACIYNVFGIPLAMGFFLPLGLYMHPMLASAAMAFSSVSVVGSSLTLKWWKRPKDSLMPEEYAAGGRIALPATAVGTDTAGSLTAWSGMFIDSAATVISTTRGLFSSRREGYEYSQLPVEMGRVSEV